MPITAFWRSTTATSRVLVATVALLSCSTPAFCQVGSGIPLSFPEMAELEREQAEALRYYALTKESGPSATYAARQAAAFAASTPGATPEAIRGNFDAHFLIYNTYRENRLITAEEVQNRMNDEDFTLKLVGALETFARNPQQEVGVKAARVGLEEYIRFLDDAFGTSSLLAQKLRDSAYNQITLRMDELDLDESQSLIRSLGALGSESATPILQRLRGELTIDFRGPTTVESFIEANPVYGLASDYKTRQQLSLLGKQIAETKSELDGLGEGEEERQAELIDKFDSLQDTLVRELKNAAASTKAAFVEHAEKTEDELRGIRSNVTSLREYFEDRDKKEQEAAARNAATSAYLGTLRRLRPFCDEDTAEILDVAEGVTQAYLLFSTASTQLSTQGAATSGLMSAAATFNYFQAGLVLASLFMESNSKSADQMILEAVAQLRQEMHERFDRLEDILETYHEMTMQRFDNLELAMRESIGQIKTARSAVGVIASDLRALSDQVDIVSNNLQEMIEDGFVRDLNLALEVFVEAPIRRRRPLSELDALRGLSEFLVFSTISSRDAISNGPTRSGVELSDERISQWLSEKDVFRNLDNVVRTNQRRGKTRIQFTSPQRRLANPNAWFVATNGYLSVYNSLLSTNPRHKASLASDFEQLLITGEELISVLQFSWPREWFLQDVDSYRDNAQRIEELVRNAFNSASLRHLGAAFATDISDEQASGLLELPKSIKTTPVEQTLTITRGDNLAFVPIKSSEDGSVATPEGYQKTLSKIAAQYVLAKRTAREEVSSIQWVAEVRWIDVDYTIGDSESSGVFGTGGRERYIATYGRPQIDLVGRVDGREFSRVRRSFDVPKEIEQKNSERLSAFTGEVRDEKLLGTHAKISSGRRSAAGIGIAGPVEDASRFVSGEEMAKVISSFPVDQWEQVDSGRSESEVEFERVVSSFRDESDGDISDHFIAIALGRPFSLVGRAESVPPIVVRDIESRLESLSGQRALLRANLSLFASEFVSLSEVAREALRPGGLKTLSAITDMCLTAAKIEVPSERRKSVVAAYSIADSSSALRNAIATTPADTLVSVENVRPIIELCDKLRRLSPKISSSGTER
jgi:hypothetical protein